MIKFLQCLPDPARGDRAWAVFTDETDLPWLTSLKRGFRHCMVVVEAQETWVHVDPLASGIVVVCEPARPRERPYETISTGRPFMQPPTVVETRIRCGNQRFPPFSPLTCVATVKRVLGIFSWRIVTPWQLYRHLCRPDAPPGPPRFTPPMACVPSLPASGPRVVPPSPCAPCQILEQET